MGDFLAVGHLKGVDELALNLLMSGDNGPPLDHRVQRSAKVRQLVGPARAQTPAEIAGGDR